MTVTKRILSGIQPSPLHIGNYFGAIHQWVSLQKENECFFCIVDLHSLTANYHTSLAQASFETAAMYLACGIDPKQSTLFIQSSVPYHTQLLWLLATKTPLGWLNRMTQFKDNKAKDESLGLYTYPVLMAADILLYDAHLVPVGEDQKQHIEFTRDLALRVNGLAEKDLFVIPEPMMGKSNTRVMSLKDGTAKMSKSDPSELSRLLMTDTRDAIVRKIKGAKTDSEPWPNTPSDLVGRPEMTNLLSLLSVLKNQSMTEILQTVQSCKNLKEMLMEEMFLFLNPIQAKYHDLIRDRSFVLDVLNQGNTYAQEVAYGTFDRIQHFFMD
ncbi:MAG: tryptophan--tRNA ligase [Alphaproteobacteria bacterium]|nr:tryptophan--tRNA ligase [Alphaproteobacteria bacterium]